MHLELRDWKLKDLEIYKHWHLGQHRWMDFNGPYYPQISMEQLESKLAQLKDSIEKNNWPTIRERMVISNSNDDLIGTVSWYWQSKETNWMSIGIALYDDGHWGKGYGKQALSLWVDYLFSKDSDLLRLDLRTWSGNHGMIKLAIKLGFQEEARFRMARIVNGEYYDSIAMGILRSEWLES